MSSQHQLADLTPGLTHGERFYFASDAAHIPPTNEASIPQAAVEPGVPEPDEANTSVDAVSIAVVGNLRQDATSDPTILIQMEDLQATVGPVSLADLEAGRVSVDEYLASRQAQQKIAVPRFAIQRTNFDQGDDTGLARVSAAWELFQEIDANPPDADGGVAAIAQKGGAKFGEDRAGNSLLAIPALDGSPTANLVAVWRLKPSESSTFAHVLTIDLNGDVGGNANAYAGDVAWVRRGDDLYLLCATRHPTTNYGTFEVFLLTGTDGDEAAAIYVGRGFCGGDSAPNELTAVDTTGGVLVALKDGSYTGRMGLSLDLRTWSDGTADAGLVEFSEIALQAGGRDPEDEVEDIVGSVTDLQALDALTAWACTGRGYIYSTRNGGYLWSNTVVPNQVDAASGRTPAPLYSVSAFGSTVIAVGANGAVLKSSNSGASFKVIRYGGGKNAWSALYAAADVEAAEVVKTDLPAITLRKVKLITANRGWAVGEKGAVYYTADAGSTWVQVVAPTMRAPWLDFVVDDAASGNVMLLVGRRGANDDSAASADAGKCAALLLNAETTSPTITKLAEDPDGFGFVAATIQRNADRPAPNDAAAIGYAITLWGRVYRFAGNGTTVAFTEIAQLSRAYDYTDIDAPDEATGGSPGDVVAAGFAVSGPSAIFQATGANTGTAVSFTGQRMNDRPTSVVAIDLDVGLIGAKGGIWRASASRNQRTKFNFLALEGGAVIMACRNVDKRWTEIYRGERPAPGVMPAFVLQQALPEAQNRAPFMAANVDGQIVMAVGKTHYVSPDGGRTWITPGDPRVPVPLSDLGEDADYVETGGNMDTRRAIAQYGGGVLYSATVSADFTKVGIHRAWHWSESSPYGRPRIDGVPLSLGVDGLRGVFAGSAAPRDIWRIRPRYLYRASHVATPSPSAEVWRSKGVADTCTFEWDAEDEAVAVQVGTARTFFGCSLFGLFGTDFRTAIFKISDPSNPASFTSKTVALSIDSGTATGPAAVVTSNILKVAGKTWTPGDFAPGVRTYYVLFQNQDVAFRIVRNGTDWIEIEGPADLSGDSTARAFVIYADRICWRGDGGTGPGSAGLLGSDYQFGRILQAQVPPQATPDGYFTIGRAFLGLEVPIADDARSFLYGMKFRLLTNTDQDVSRGGIKVVRHFGRTGRVWEIVYPLETTHELATKLNSLLGAIRDEFVVQWDGADANSCTLVRLVDAPEIEDSYGTFTSSWALEEVQ